MYGSLPSNGPAEDNAKIHTAMTKAEKAGLTWAGFEKKYPKVFRILSEILKRSGLVTFDGWLEEITKEKGRGRRIHSQIQETPASKAEYMQTTRWERMPSLEELFNSEVALEHAPALSAPYDGSVMWIHREITDELGDV